MGRSKSAAQLTDKMNKAARELVTNQPAMIKVAAATKALFVTEAGRVGVGRGIGKTRVSRAVGVSYDVKGGQNATALVRYTGPAHILNNPTKSHPITPRKRSGKKAIVINGAVRASAVHPGTKGLGFFEKARVRADFIVPPLVRRELVREPLRRIFG